MSVESERDLIGLRRVGRVVALALDAMRRAVRPGVTTAELDAVGASVFARHSARSAPQLAYGFPGTNCISLNDEAVHGVPSETRLIRTGDLVKIDVTAELGGYMADACATVEVSSSTPTKQRLIRTATVALRHGLLAAHAGTPVVAIGTAVERCVVRRGYHVIHQLGGHGIGRAIHEAPSIPNFADPGNHDLLTPGLVVTVEPIIAAGIGRIGPTRPDGWTLPTRDGSLSAHVEHTIVVTMGAPLVLTRL